MKTFLIIVLSLLISFKLCSSEKIKELDLADGLSALEAFRELEIAIKTQTNENLVMLVSPGLPGHIQERLELRDFYPIVIIDILCSRMDLSYLQNGDLVIIAKDDKSLTQVKEAFQIHESHMPPIVKMIETSSAIIVVRYVDRGEKGKVPLISEVLKNEPNNNIEFVVGDVFEPLEGMRRRENVDYGDGRVAFLVGDPPKLKYQLAYEDEVLRKPRGMLLAELRDLIENSESRPDPDFQPEVQRLPRFDLIRSGTYTPRHLQKMRNESVIRELSACSGQYAT